VEAAGPARRFGRDLTVGSIPRHLVAFSLPMLAGSALQTAYSFINAIWVGNFLGKNALAAVTVSFPVVFVLIAIGAGLTLATNILISQHYGARDMAAVRRVVHSSTVLIAALSVVLLSVGEILTPHILRAMDTPSEVLPLASQYMRIFLFTLPLGFGLFLTRSMLQGIGDSTTPLYFQTAAVLLTTVLDPVLMFGWLGMPALGLNGTAYATLIAQTLALAALVALLRRRGNPAAPAIGLKGFHWRTALTTIRIGIPSAVQQSLVSLGMVFVTGIINGFGANATAAFGAASRIDQLAFMPAMTFAGRAEHRRQPPRPHPPDPDIRLPAERRDHAGSLGPSGEPAAGAAADFHQRRDGHRPGRRVPADRRGLLRLLRHHVRQQRHHQRRRPHAGHDRDLAGEPVAGARAAGVVAVAAYRRPRGVVRDGRRLRRGHAGQLELLHDRPLAPAGYASPPDAGGPRGRLWGGDGGGVNAAEAPSPNSQSPNKRQAVGDCAYPAKRPLNGSGS